MTRVFISSTSKDLQPERKALLAALQRMRDAAIIAMEFFGSRPEDPKTVCLQEVRNCDFYIGIFAQYYGSIDPESGRSMTELEYQEAQKAEKPCLIYLKAQSVKIPSEFQESEPARQKQLETLKADLTKTHVVTFFTSADNLATQVVLDLHNELSGSAPIGSGQRTALPSLNRTQEIKKKFAQKAIQSGRIADDVVKDMLGTLKDVLKGISSVAAGFDNSAMSEIAERFGSLLEKGVTNERYRLLISVPVIPLILDSQERITIEGADKLEAIWKRLTAWHPGWRVKVSAGILGSVCVYLLAVQLILWPQMLDIRSETFPDNKDGPGKLSAAIWRYDSQERWIVRNNTLFVKDPGLAILRMDHSKKLYDFTLSFLIRIDSGERAGWILRAQENNPGRALGGYAFWLRVSEEPSRVVLEAEELPDKMELRPILGQSELPIGPYDRKKDILQIEARVRGSELGFKVTRTSTVEHYEERMKSESFGIPVNVTFTGRSFRHGTVGLYGVEKDGDEVQVQQFHLKPVRRWLYF